MFKRLCEILDEYAEIPKEEMKPESDILNDLEMNSLDVMGAVVAVEEEFSVTVPDRVISSFRTLGDIIVFLEKNAGSHRNNR